MAREAFKTSDAAVWIQPDGPNTAIYYLGCVDVDDIAESGGGIAALSQCFAQDGGWRTVNYTTNPPEAVTTTLHQFVGEVRSYLEAQRNRPLNIFFQYRDGGRPNIFTNYKLGSTLYNALIGDRTRSGRGMRSEDTDAQNSFAVTALPPVLDYWQLQVVRNVTGDALAINNIAFCNIPQGASDSAPASALCEVGYMAGDADTGVAPVVWATTDSGGTWAATAADPFAADDDINGLVCFPITGNGTRVVVGCGTTDAGNPAKIAYTDDSGATWTEASLGATNALFFANPHALFALDLYNVWAGLSGGHIYKSVDGAKTWTAQTAATVTTENIHSIHFANDRVGFAGAAADVILRTIDGGSTWSQVTATGAGAIINSVFCLDSQRAWAGTSNGKLFYTLNGGTTWTQRRFDGDTAGAVKSVKFVNTMQGFMLHQTAGPVGSIYRTVDGGFTWEKITTPTNAGLNNLAVCDGNLAWAVGEIQGGTGVLLKALVL